MEKEILSLRNIYRLLMVKDYPVYSTGVFKEDNRKGMTLTKFWQENLLYEWKSGYYGKLIWKTTGSRNRHLSEMCNRSEVLKWYPQYTEELVAGINEKNLLLQIGQFMNCLKERRYDAAVLEKKLLATLPLFEAQDEFCGTEVIDFLQRGLTEGREGVATDEETMLFVHAWMLTFLSLHAMAGNQMSGEQLRKVRENEQFAPQTLWKLYRKNQRREPEEVHFLTNQNNALCITPLSMMHFFGRERELFDLREILEQGGYYLLSGMGGIGKTELLRQLLHLCVEQKLVDEIAVIQYEGGLKASCMSAFPNMHMVDGENTLNEAMARIRIQEGKRVLTLVDNMNKTLEEDPDLAQLLTLPGTVILTSRLTSLEGFTIYEVKTPSKETGMLIFRDNYGKVLSKDDKEELQVLMEQEVFCHTLTLRLLGSTAKVKGWTVKMLKENLEADGSQLFKARENREINLAEMYRRMYDLSGLERSQHKLLRSFALLPYRNYALEFCKEYLADCCCEGVLKQQLMKLKAYGWLAGSGNEYSMHPVIAECIMTEKLTEEDAVPFLTSLIRHWEKNGASEGDDFESWFTYSMSASREDQELIYILMYVREHISGDVSERFVKAGVLAGIMEYANRERLIQTEKYLLDLKRTYIHKNLFKDWITILCLSTEDNEEVNYRMHIAGKNNGCWLQQMYTYVVIGNMLNKGQLNEVQVLLDTVTKDSLSVPLRMLITYLESKLHFMTTRFNDSSELSESVVQMAKEINISNSVFLLRIYQLRIEVLLNCGEIEKALQYIQITKEIIEEQKTIEGQLILLYGSATLYRCIGRYEESFEVQKEKINLLKSMSEMKGELAVAFGDTGLILIKLARYEDAEKYFMSAIEQMNEIQNMEIYEHRVYNNMADMYICWNKPQQAIECMKKSTEYGKDIQGIGLAERYRNFARAYRLAEDLEKEYENLKQAVPLLAEAYGPDHERTVAMRERLEEVEKLRVDFTE